jgi:hypothetical protein
MMAAIPVSTAVGAAHDANLPYGGEVLFDDDVSIFHLFSDGLAPEKKRLPTESPGGDVAHR